MQIGLKNRQIDADLNLSIGAFSKQFKAGKTLGIDKVEHFLQKHNNINPGWLLTGEGSMLKSDDELPSASPKCNFTALRSEPGIGYPLVEQHAIAGFGNASFSIAQEDVKDYYVVPKFKNNRIDFMIEVRGSSMYPKYNSGDVIACTIIRESTFIQWNKCHVIATHEQGILVKRIKRGPTDNLVTAVSDNKNYDPFDIPTTEITGLALVVGVIRLE